MLMVKMLMMAEPVVSKNADDALEVDAGDGEPKDQPRWLTV